MVATTAFVSYVPINGGHHCLTQGPLTASPYLHIHTGSPSDLALAAVNSTALGARWLPPTSDPNDGILLSYQATCTASGDGHMIRYTLHTEVTTGVVLGTLVPYTYYHCCVWIVTTKASGPQACQWARTSEDST